MILRRTGLATVALTLVGATQPAPVQSLDDRAVSTTIVPGSGAIPSAAPPATALPRSGDVNLNFPGVDIQAVAKSVFGDMLRVPYIVSPSLHTAVTVVTQRPIARSSVPIFMEGALRAAGLAMVAQNGGYTVVPVEQARDQAAEGTSAGPGFASETLTLHFVGAEQFRRLADPLIPGVIVAANGSANTVTIAGTSGQRSAVRGLVRQFDVNWLRNMSFALYVPQRTDARLIVPELEKLINGAGAPTAGLVRLIAMEQLNGVLAISTQPQYLEDARRWVEILDREGQSNERRLFVYRVENGRSADLSRALINAFGGGAGGAAGSNGSEQQQPGAMLTNGAGPPPGFGNAIASNGKANAMSTDASGIPTRSMQDQGASAVPTTNGAGAGQQGSAWIAGSSGNPITISSDDANNAVVVCATSRDYAVIEDALHKLDLPPLQVVIDAAITEVTLTNDLQYGVQWLFNQPKGSVGYSENTTSGLPTQIFPGLSGIIARQSITATLNALSKLTKINVVSAPKLLVINNQTASLQVGDEVPVTTASAIGTINANSPIVNQVEYRDTGVILKITPRVNSGGLVLLDVAQEVSSVSQTTTSSIDSPTISTRKVATSIAVQDGETIALGGLITDRLQKGKNGIPLLSTLPIIGALFGTHTDLRNRTELVVLLKPRVIRTSDDGRAYTEELRSNPRAIMTRPPAQLGDLP